MRLSEVLDEATQALRQRLGSVTVPETLVVLGSGFKGFGSTLARAVKVELRDIKHFPVPRVAGHGADLLIGDSGKTRVCVLTGRAHMYEGYSAAEVVLPIRVLARLGVKRILLTNATGSLHKSFRPGTVVSVTDQMNLTGHTCLLGAEELGPIFLNMSGCFDAAWSKKIARLDKKIKPGIYIGALGPAYETPAEARMFAKLGGHVIGMSTVQEVLAARQLGLQVACLSFITNVAGGVGETLTHEDVLAMAKKHGPRLEKLIGKAVAVQ